MFSYENGVIVCILLSLYRAVSLLLLINSTYSKNLRRIGLRVRWSELTVVEIEKSDVNQSFLKKIAKFLTVIGVEWIFFATSWLYVLVNVGLIVYRYSKDSGAPERVKNYRWKMKNVNMTYEQVIKEHMKLNEMKEEDFEQVKKETIQSMEERGLPQEYLW